MRIAICATLLGAFWGPHGQGILIGIRIEDLPALYCHSHVTANGLRLVRPELALVNSMSRSHSTQPCPVVLL